jgi:hypothetical protein
LNFDAKCSLVQLQSVAATARLSLEGTLKKKNSGALLTITEALHGLVNSLELFQDSFETASAHHTALINYSKDSSPRCWHIEGRT